MDGKLDPATRCLTVRQGGEPGDHAVQPPGCPWKSSWSTWAIPSRHLQWLPPLAASVLPCGGPGADCNACDRCVNVPAVHRRSVDCPMLTLVQGENISDYALLKSSDIVVSTPEHWDMLSRRWHAKARAEVRNVALFIVDELHLIGGRNGPAIEVNASSWQLLSSQDTAWSVAQCISALEWWALCCHL